MYIPIFINSEPSKCPHCRKNEDIKQVCRNCGYEYQEDHGIRTLATIAFVFFATLFILYFSLTIFAWVFDDSGHSLLNIMQAQWEAMKQLKIF